MMNLDSILRLSICTVFLCLPDLRANERWVDVLENVRGEGFEGWKPEQIVGYALVNSRAVEASSYTKGVLLLWMNREFPHLELLWWKSKDSEKRRLIVSCFYLLTDEGGDFRDSPNWPSFSTEALRFSTEREARQQEILDAQQTNQELKDALKKSISVLKKDINFVLRDKN